MYNHWILYNLRGQLLVHQEYYKKKQVSQKNKGAYLPSILRGLIWFLNANHHSLTTVEETIFIRKKSSRWPSLIWQAIYSWENNCMFFFSFVTWLFDVIVVAVWLKIGSLWMGSNKIFVDDFRRLFTKLLNCSFPRVSIKFTAFTTFLFAIFACIQHNEVFRRFQKWILHVCNH